MIGLGLICCGLIFSVPAWSFDKAQREALIASLDQGEVFENDGSTYVCLPTLRGEKATGREAASAKKGTADAVMGEVVERKGSFTIYRQSAVLETRAGDNQAHPIVFNLKTKSLGILTGKLWLKLKDLEDALPMADAYDMTISFVNIPMSTAFYKISSRADILTLRKDLEKDPRVLRVTLDMVDRIRRPY